MQIGARDKRAYIFHCCANRPLSLISKKFALKHVGAVLKGLI